MDDSPRVSIDSEIKNESAAHLAANEEDFLNTVHESDDHLKQEELAAWIGEILGEHLNADALFEDLNNGVRLLYLAKSLQLVKCNHLKDSNYEKAVEHLKPDEYSNNGRYPPKRASQIAKQRSNIAKFLEWCINIGVPNITLFETEDLTHRKNLRQVTTCLFYVSKIASRFGIEPPSSVKEELKIEEAQRKGDDEPFDSSPMLHGDLPSRSKNELVTNQIERGSYQMDPHVSQRNKVLEETLEQLPDRHTHESSPNHSELTMALKFDSNSSEDQIDPAEPTRYIQTIREDDRFHFRPLETRTILELPRYDDDNSPVGHQSHLIPIPECKESRSPSDSSFTELKLYQRLTDSNFPDFTVENDESYRSLTPPPGNIPHAYLSTLAEMKAPNRPRSPFSLYRVPADIIVESYGTDESTSEDVASEDLTCDCDHGKAYVDVATGSDEPLTTDAFDYVPEEEIMIDFPPYFELSGFSPKEYSFLPPLQEYIVAPVRDDQIYSVPNKSSTERRREQHNNPVGEMKIDEVREQPPIAYQSLNTDYVRRWRDSSDFAHSSLPTPSRRATRGTAQNEIGTQTHVTYTDDVIRILGEKNDYSKAPDNRPSASGRGPAEPVIIRSQYQRTLPMADDDVSVTQASDLGVSRTARWGSANSSARVRNDAANTNSPPTAKPASRGIVRRTSSRVSQRLRKAAFAAKKYTKRTIVVAILFVLALGVLAAILAVSLSR